MVAQRNLRPLYLLIRVKDAIFYTPAYFWNASDSMRCSQCLQFKAAEDCCSKPCQRQEYNHVFSGTRDNVDSLSA